MPAKTGEEREWMAHSGINPFLGWASGSSEGHGPLASQHSNRRFFEFFEICRTFQAREFLRRQFPKFFQSSSKISVRRWSKLEGEEKSGMNDSQTHAQWFLAPYCIGAKLRSLRTEKRLTLARLAAETSLSTALLSKLETDRMLPTLSTLATICRVYGVGLGHFFCDPAEHLLSVTRNVAGQGRGRSPEEGTRVPLNPSLTQRKLDAAMVHLPPGSHTPEVYSNVERAMLVYVLDGELQMDVGGLRETLSAGDCAYLESDLPTTWGSVGDGDCRLLTVVAKPPSSREFQASATEGSRLD